MKQLAYLLMALPLLFSKDKDIFSSKSLESRMVKVSEQLYANKYETSNREYREFLNWARENKAAIISEAEVKADGWSQILKSDYLKSYFDHPGFQEYPVVNITYEGANHFCDWLTDKYNNTKKRKFGKVKFRLPTKDEWVAMAMNGKTYAMNYPWGGPYLKNKQGHYLANFYRVGNQALKINIKDRTKVEIQGQAPSANQLNGPANITTPVTSYMATGAGLHNLSGNAAEMLSEKGSTKGGSWGSSGYYLKIQAEDEFEGFEYSPYVGFRYVMEVIED